MASRLPRERTNVALLANGQTLFLTAAITVMTSSGLVGQRLTPEPALATLPVALMQVGTVLFTLPASLLMKRIGRRPGFLVGIGLGAVGGAVATAGVAISSFWLFNAGNLLLGAYQGFAMYYRFAAAECASESFRSKAISLVMAGGVVAAFLGPWNADRARALWPTHPEAGPFLVITVLAIVAALLVAFLRVPPSTEPVAGRRPGRPLGVIAAQPAFRVALLAASVGYAVMILVMTATPLAVREAGYGMAEASRIMQWHVLGMFAPSFITGHLIARFGIPNVLLTGAAILIAAATVALASTTFWHFWVALLLLGVGWNLLFIGGSTLLTRTHSPEERGKVQGVNDLTIFSLVAIASLMAGALLHSVGWAGLNAAVLPPLALTLVAAARLKRRDASSSPAEDAPSPAPVRVPGEPR